jgi:hypothetical protein
MTTVSRVTDRAGVVHVVTDMTEITAKSACGKNFHRGTGGSRVWQLARGHQHEICGSCSKQLTDCQRSEGDRS